MVSKLVLQTLLPKEKIEKVYVSEAKPTYINYGYKAIINQISIYELANKVKKMLVDKGYKIDLSISKAGVALIIKKDCIKLLNIVTDNEEKAIFMGADLILIKEKRKCI